MGTLYTETDLNMIWSHDLFETGMDPGSTHHNHILGIGTGLAAVARARPRRRHLVVSRAGGMAEGPDQTLSGRDWDRLRDAARRRRADLRLRATERRRSDDGPGPLGKSHLAHQLPRTVQDEPLDRSARSGAEVYADLRRQPDLHARHERQGDGIRRRHRKTALAEAVAAG